MQGNRGRREKEKERDETVKIYDESRRPRTGMRRSHCATAKTGTGKESHCVIMTTKTVGRTALRDRELNVTALRGKETRARGEMRTETGDCTARSRTRRHCTAREYTIGES